MQSSANNEDGLRVLRDLARRWRGANSLSYRSVTVMQHQGELRVDLRSFVRLRRPGLARVVYSGNQPEVNRVRMSDGRRIVDRARSGATMRLPWRGRISEGISHPLDDGSYSAEQFFRPDPFVPPFPWGDPGEPIAVLADRTTLPPSKDPLLRLTITRGTGPSKDTLWLDAYTLAPVRLIRFGDHGGMPQELLREDFSDVKLGPALPDSLFTWTAEDQAGTIR